MNQISPYFLLWGLNVLKNIFINFDRTFLFFEFDYKSIRYSIFLIVRLLKFDKASILPLIELAQNPLNSLYINFLQGNKII